MWAALALTTVLNLAPAQAGELGVSNVRATYGILGQTREDKKVLPGDVFYIAFDVTNLKVKPDGRVQYAMGMELIRKGKTKPEFKREPQDVEAVNTLGGTTLPLVAYSLIGTDALPGEYTLKVLLKDRIADKTVSVQQNFEVVDLKTRPGLGFIQVRFTSVGGEPTPPVGVPGQAIALHCALVGYQKDKKESLPNVTFEMQVLDESGKPTVKDPFKGDIKSEPKSTPGMMTFQPITLQLNRPGKFKVVLKATCNISKKSAEQTLDLEVLNR
jgi:hypothetical protein